MLKPLEKDATPPKVDVVPTLKYPVNSKSLKVKLVAFKVVTVKVPAILTFELKVATPPKVDVVQTVK